MRLQLDTKNKTIKVEEDVNVEEFLKVIKRMFPGDSWKEFTLETNTVIYYSPWITWDYQYPYCPQGTGSPYPWYTWQSDTSSISINTDAGIDGRHTLTTNYTLVDGVYNVNATL
jgi:hypothetical protein